MMLGSLTAGFTQKNLILLSGIDEPSDNKFLDYGGSVGFGGLFEGLECNLELLHHTWTS